MTLRPQPRGLSVFVRSADRFFHRLAPAESHGDLRNKYRPF